MPQLVHVLARRLNGFALALLIALPFAAQAQSCTSFSLNPTSQEFVAAGGTGLITINASPAGCTTARTASTTASWISFNFGTSGNGAGSVGYTVQANTTANTRTGTITAAGQTFTVTQAGTPCTFSISPTSAAFTSEGGTGAVTIGATPSGCASSRTASTNASWITLGAGATGTGEGTLVYTVAANTGASPRSATITVAGRTLTVTQEAVVCNYSISPTSASFPAAGGNDQVTISVTPNNCSSSRTAVSNANWITISFGAAGSGAGTVGYTVQPNNFTVERTGTITIAGNTLTVRQGAGSCTFQLSPASTTIPSVGGTGGFTVTPSNQGCTWTAVNNAPDLITLTSSDSGTGTGRVEFAVGPNSTTASRTGSITVGNATHNVTLAAACRISGSPTGASFAGAGGTGTIAISTAGSGCAWTATANHDFITITSGFSGTSSGNVGYAVAANLTGADRTGSISVGDFGFHIFQSSNCSYALSQTLVSLPASGGTGTFTISSACPWNLTTTSDWIQVLPAAGTGNGTVTYVVAGNTSTAARTGSITVGGGAQVRISQEGAPCSLNVSPAALNAQAAGDTLTVNVDAPAGCDWAPSSTATFISGFAKGEGGFTFVVEANHAPTVRRAAITVADKVVSVSQDAAVCEYTLTPGRANFGSAGGAGSFEVATNCSWTAQSQAGWIVIPQGSAAGNGNGTVRFNVGRLATSEARTGLIRIGAATFTVTQSTSPCALNVSPATLEISGTGGRGTIQVSGGPTCRWSPSKDADWLAITSWSSINGSGVVNVQAGANPEVDARSAPLRISAAGAETQAVNVVQGGLTPVVEAVANQASRVEGGPVAIGTLVRVRGESMGPDTAVLADRTGEALPTDLAGVQLLFDGIPAPLLSVSRTLIEAVVPFGLGTASQAVEVVVRNNGVDSRPLNLSLVAAAPAVFVTEAATGRGQVLAQNQNNTPNSAANAAARNETVSFLVTGLGQVRPEAVDGRIYRQANGLPAPVQTVTVQIGGQAAAVTAAAVALGETAGVIRVTARIAQNAATGGAVPVIVRAGAASVSQAGITIAVR